MKWFQQIYKILLHLQVQQKLTHHSGYNLWLQPE